MSLILLGNLYMSLIKVSLINHNVCMSLLPDVVICRKTTPISLRNAVFANLRRDLT